jgi:uncharacterized protein (TIGR02391 family)
MTINSHDYIHIVRSKIEKAITTLSTIREGFLDDIQDGQSSKNLSAIKAYEGLELHPQIAGAASTLFKNGHYANSIEDAVKALCQLIRDRTGLQTDGISLMQTVFSVKNPLLIFNQLKDESDKNEQKGFMDWYTGTISALRNPRAHKLISDTPEMALEFIAFISLLAKLVDQASSVGSKSVS